MINEESDKNDDLINNFQKEFWLHEKCESPTKVFVS